MPETHPATPFLLLRISALNSFSALAFFFPQDKNEGEMVVVCRISEESLIKASRKYDDKIDLIWKIPIAAGAVRQMPCR